MSGLYTKPLACHVAFFSEDQGTLSVEQAVPVHDTGMLRRKQEAAHFGLPSTSTNGRSLSTARHDATRISSATAGGIAAPSGQIMYGECILFVNAGKMSWDTDVLPALAAFNSYVLRARCLCGLQSRDDSVLRFLQKPIRGRHVRTQHKAERRHSPTQSAKALVLRAQLKAPSVESRVPIKHDETARNIVI